MPWDKSNVQCYGRDKPTEHYVAGRLVRYATKVVAQEETHATSLLGDHTLKEEELISIYNT